jgi:hypothetical protein
MVLPFAQWRWSNCLPPIFRTFVWTVKYFDPDLKKINPGSRKPEEALTKRGREGHAQPRAAALLGARRQAAARGARLCVPPSTPRDFAG